MPAWPGRHKYVSGFREDAGGGIPTPKENAMHDHHIGNGYTAGQGAQQLSHALERTLEQNRALLEEMARFTKDESLRLAHRQLDFADNAMTQFHERRDFGSLIGAQQEWVKQTMQEYATLGLRYAEMFQALTQRVQSHVENAASDFRHQAEDEMEDLGHDLQDRPHTHAGPNGMPVPLQAE
jgi:hypothetical protein